MRFAVASGLFAAAFVGCGGDAAPVDPDAHVALVTGCDDPTLWSAPALEPADLRSSVGGGPCTPAQYPLHLAYVGWSPDGPQPPSEEWSRLDRTCWRVVEASPGSGWSAGDQLAGGRDGVSLLLAGFGATVTLEGRVLRDDGAVAFATAIGTVALDAATVLDADAGATTAVISPEAWVEHDAVELWGQRVATDEIVDATGDPILGPSPRTLHRTADGFVHRRWRRQDDELRHDDLALGPGTRARIPKFGGAVVVDTELVFLGRDGDVDVVRDRVPLGAEPAELTGTWDDVTLHVGDTLVRYDYPSLTPSSLAVGPGVLLPTPSYHPPVFFDGASFRTLGGTADALAFDDTLTFMPRPEDLAAIGAPVAVHHGIVFGERGLLAGLDAASPIAGPRVATYAELFGGGTLGPVAVDSAAYVIARDDGSAALYDAPFVDFCE